MALMPQADAPLQIAEENPAVPHEDAVPFEDRIETILSMIGG
jgi:hypothetical protein